MKASGFVDSAPSNLIFSMPGLRRRGRRRRGGRGGEGRARGQKDAEGGLKRAGIVDRECRQARRARDSERAAAAAGKGSAAASAAPSSHKCDCKARKEEEGMRTRGKSM